MLKLPIKRSKNWIYIGLILFVVSFVSLVMVGMLFNPNLSLENIGAFAFLSLIITVLISIGGYLGAKAYFYTSFIFYIIALIFMFSIAINNTSDGWSDLISFISFLYIVALGFILGVLIQLITFLISKYKKK